jgi:hypothetical protein
MANGEWRMVTSNWNSTPGILINKIMNILSSSEASDSSDDEDLKVNITYAKKFEKQKRFQDLQRAKELLENEGEDDDSESSSESEDENGEGLSAALDLQVFLLLLYAFLVF